MTFQNDLWGLDWCPESSTELQTRTLEVWGTGICTLQMLPSTSGQEIWEPLKRDQDEVVIPVATSFQHTVPRESKVPLYFVLSFHVKILSSVNVFKDLGRGTERINSLLFIFSCPVFLKLEGPPLYFGLNNTLCDTMEHSVGFWCPGPYSVSSHCNKLHPLILLNALRMSVQTLIKNHWLD